MEDSHLKDKKINDVLSRRLSLVDLLLEDDSLIENQEQRSAELFEFGANQLVDFYDTLKQKEQLPQRSDCVEPIRKYNSRNSFSWNISFFTCEGVLDDEELASLITVEKHVFPEIQEEVHRSADSISTLKGSEACLFKDVRASIQKSSKATKSTEEKSEGGSGMRKTKASCASKMGNLASQDKMKTKVAPNKPSISMQNPPKLVRQVSASRQIPQTKPKVATNKPSISMQNPPKLVRQVSASRQIPQMKPKVVPNKPSISSVQNPRKLARQVSASPLIPQMKPKVVPNKPSISMQNPRKLVRQVYSSPEIPQKSSKATNSREERREGGSGVGETKASCTLKSGNLASQDKMKTKVVHNKPSIRMENRQKLARQVSASLKIPQSLAGSRESASSLLKRPKALEKPSSVSTTAAKRASLSVRGAPVSKLLGSSRVPRPALPSKSSSSSSSTATRIESTSSFKSSGGISSLKFGTSPSNSTKKKTDFRTGNIPTSSASNPKAPSRIVVKNKSQPGKSNLSAHLMPLSKLSSISSSSRKSFNRSSCKRVCIDCDTTHASASQESQVSGSVGQCALRASTAMGGLPPASKPSGLRLPTPKIGFFDELGTPSFYVNC